MILHTGIYDYSFDVSVALPKGANQHEPMAHISKVKLLLKLLLYKKMLLYNSLPPEPTDLHFFLKCGSKNIRKEQTRPLSLCLAP